MAMTLKLTHPTARPDSDPQGPVSADPSPQTWSPLPAAGPPLAQVLSPQCSATFSLPEPEAKPPTLAALKAFRKLAGLWQLGMCDQLALLGLRETQKATYYRWLREAQSGARSLQLDRDQMARISHLLAIFESVGQLFQIPEQADAWVHRPNRHPVFQGRPPLERLVRGGMEDLIAVRAYVEGAREGLV
jgi:uncharacterized protein (DUF2384 family)